MSTITIGVDLAKSVFSVCAVDGAGHVQRRQDLGREAFALWLAQMPAGTVVAMEVCSGAHYWARRCLEVGLQPRLMAAQFVTPFRKSRVIKNDSLGDAACRGHSRYSTRDGVRSMAPMGSMPITVNRLRSSASNSSLCSAHVDVNQRQKTAAACP